jgi:amino acid transporter
MGNKIGLGWMSNILALLITLGGIGGMMAWFTGAARMPFVAGIDNYLPKGFGKIHPRYGSPYIAVLIQASIASIFILISFIGTTVREAYLVLLDTALLIYFVPYVYMFLAYIHFSRKDSGTDTGKRMPKSKPLAIIIGLSGLLTSLFAVAMSILPPAGTENIMLYEVKVIGGFFLFVFVGAYIYLKKR